MAFAAERTGFHRLPGPPDELIDPYGPWFDVRSTVGSPERVENHVLRDNADKTEIATQRRPNT